MEKMLITNEQTQKSQLKFCNIQNNGLHNHQLSLLIRNTGNPVSTSTFSAISILFQHKTEKKPIYFIPDLFYFSII